MLRRSLDQTYYDIEKEEEMENQHEKIKGYRNLSDSEIELMNEAKELAEEIGDFTKRLQKDRGLDQRWISIGSTDLQKGFMSLIRGIAQPTTF